MTGKSVPHSPSRYLLMLMFFCCANFVEAQSQTVTAAVQPAQVTVGDPISYQVSIVLNGSGNPSVAVPALSPATGLSNPSPAGQQSSLESNYINGSIRSVQRITYMYSITTSKAGSFTIPPATVTINGQSYETKPLQVQVSPLAQAANIPTELAGLVAAPVVSGNADLQRKLTGVIFILPVLSNNKPYNGEQVRISYHLVIEPEALAAAGLLPRTNLDGVKVPPMNEFITEELYPFPQDLKFQERKIGGKLYLVAPVYDAAISSTKSGKLDIEPFQVSMIFSTRGRPNQVPSPFADDPFFSTLSPLAVMGGNSVQVIAQSPVLSLDVQPVPTAGTPANYSGAVGTFTIQTEVDRKQAKAYDDTITMDVTVQGKGNTESLSPPHLPDMPGFTVLGDPEQKSDGHKEKDDYISEKKFSYTLRPTLPGKQAIPPIEMSYFDPEKKEFKSAASEAIAIDVAPGSRPAPVQSPSAVEEKTKQDQPPAAPDLQYISTKPLTPPASGLERFSGTSGLAVFLFPPALLAAAGLVCWRRKQSLHKSTDSRKLTRLASLQHLKLAETALAAGHTKEMTAELSEGIRLHFASKFSISAAEATIPEIEDQLSRKGAPAELIAGITSILETCDTAQYAPASVSGADSRTIYTDAIRLIKESEAFS